MKLPGGEIELANLAENAGYFGNSTPPDFETSFTGDISPNIGAWVEVWNAGHGAQYIQLSGHPEFLKKVGASQNARFGYCGAT
jgi:hypothetical protein